MEIPLSRICSKSDNCSIQVVSIQRGKWSLFGSDFEEFRIFSWRSAAKKSRLSERGTSEFRDFGVASLGETRNSSPERENKII